MATNNATDIIRQSYSFDSPNAQQINNDSKQFNSGSYGEEPSLRLQALRNEGVTPGANAKTSTNTPAISKTPVGNVNDTGAIDWRVSLRVPNEINQGNVLAPLKLTDNKMIFPFNPTIILGHSANYDTISPTHTNYPFYAYQNSQVDQFTISGSFISENAADAAYWIAAVHFLRTMTKMFYGNGGNVGKPPAISRLNGYGKHVFNNIPVLITNFTTDLPQDVDYISCAVDGETNYAPTESLITVNCVPNYARTTVAQFDLQKYARGDFVGGSEGFV